ncbi:glycoside hydrolase superfamily [Phaeosphaeria sp. MPI-PUGE-AT-0046c]|nr:glycoside hydrolase superfamily [Phaeosphaeria sp. MPI-PUGE-AT-0046c]
MKISHLAQVLLAGNIQVKALSIRQAASQQATVNIDTSTGKAAFQASGWIYGFPDNGVEADTSIPEEFIRDVKFIGSRAGGAQTPTRGWIDGYKSYVPRLESTISNYRTTRKYGGAFILLVHDLWGADGSQIPLYPGDNGNWTETDNFLRQVVKDLRASNMLEGLVVDIWNEPDITAFWDRPWNQYLQYYVHAHKLLRQELPEAVFSGPSMAASPSLSNTNWQTWLSTVSGNATVPDIYSWHQIGTWSREPDTTVPDFNTLKNKHNLPDLPIDVNEYAAKDEQNPGTSAYYIAQLERHNIRGLRANWGSTTALHDGLADLVVKDASGKYFPNGEWQLYKYYASMEGNRLATAASTDRLFDVFATRSGNGIKVIAGTRNTKSKYTIEVSGLMALGLPASGSVEVRKFQFDWAGDAGEVGAPKDLGTSNLAYTANKAFITFDPATASTAYAFEIAGSV